MIRKLFFLLTIFTLIFSCKKLRSEEFKKGTFKVTSNDSTTFIIERFNNFQLKYNTNFNEFSKIKWVADNAYLKEVINKKNKFDSLTFNVKLDSISKKNFHYETTYIKEVNLKFTSKLIKTNDSLSDEFITLIRTHKERAK